MRNQFPGYYKPTEEEFKKLWENCIFSFDTNILLNVYRYSPESRERLFEIWRRLDDRIWLPHQIALEYLQERLDVISHQSKPYKELQEMLDASSKSFADKIGEFSRRHSFSSYTDTNKLLKILEDAHSQIKNALNASGASYPDLLESDKFWDDITQIFDGKVGEPYSEEDLSKCFKKAKNRVEQKQPPGYKDSAKSEPERYGDVIIWFQLIDYVKSQKKPLIFVTDDEKEDWWLKHKHKGKTIGPRPELIQEMLSEGGVKFYLYTGDRFLKYAEKFLKLKEEPEVVKEAEEIRHQVEQERKSITLNKSALDSIRALHQASASSIASDALSKVAANLDAIRKVTSDSVVRPEALSFSQHLMEHQKLVAVAKSLADATAESQLRVVKIADAYRNELLQRDSPIKKAEDVVLEAFRHSKKDIE
jgi:hypothetical protein